MLNSGIPAFLAAVGNICLISSLLVVTYSIICGISGQLKNDHSLQLSAYRANFGSALLIILVMLCLSLALLSNDFSKDFVFKNSSTDLPLFYKLTGVWGGLEGSLLLWVAVLAVYIAVVSYKYFNSYRALTNIALIYLNFILAFILILLAVWSNPLRTNLPFASEGMGLNPLLQHPGMIVHPPLLYFGFIGLSVPFAFALSSLSLGKFDNAWINLTRRWTMIAWLFLTAGIFVGGLWAYEVLGWGGYWAWDPVENSSLLPWLAATAFLHSSLVQEKTSNLRNWNFFLIILAFILTIVGTFITRSGVLNSVHAFSKSNLGIYFLAFIIITGCLSIGLMIYRLPLSKSKLNIRGLFSREMLILYNNLIIIVLIFTIFYGTVYPLLLEGISGTKISIQAPFFNSIGFPLWIILMLLMSVSPHITWSKSNFPKVLPKISIAFAIAIMGAVLGYMFVVPDIKFTILTLVIIFSALLTLSYLFKSLQSAAKVSNRGFLAKYWHNKRKLGGALVHIGIILLFIGVLGKYLSSEKNISMQLGESINFADYDITFTKLEQWQEFNVIHQGPNLTISKGDENLAILTPSKANYPTSNEVITIIDVYRTLFHDLYLSLVQINNNQSITLTIYSNNLILFIPLSLIVILIGGFLTLNYKQKNKTNIVQ